MLVGGNGSWIRGQDPASIAILVNARSRRKAGVCVSLKQGAARRHPVIVVRHCNTAVRPPNPGGRVSCQGNTLPHGPARCRLNSLQCFEAQTVRSGTFFAQTFLLVGFVLLVVAVEEHPL